MDKEMILNTTLELLLTGKRFLSKYSNWSSDSPINHGCHGNIQYCAVSVIVYSSCNTLSRATAIEYLSLACLSLFGTHQIWSINDGTPPFVAGKRERHKKILKCYSEAIQMLSLDMKSKQTKVKKTKSNKTKKTRTR